jgi:hypothetical protein
VRLACTGLVLGTAESRQEPILFPSGTEGLQTLCWSKGDSNSWSHVLPERWRTDKLRSPVMAVVGAGPPMSAPFTVGLVVRIPFAPAVSPLRTRAGVPARARIFRKF